MSAHLQQQKVIKLLRLASDREGTPEGDTAQRLAETIMETYGITVAPEEVEFETYSEVTQNLIAEDSERRWWQEMLLVTLCDIYGGEAVSMSGKPWRLYIVAEPKDEVDVPQLQRHFNFLSSLLCTLRDACAGEFMRALPLDREEAVSSFCIGAVYRVSQLLYRDVTGEEPNLEHMPFMLRALKGGHETIAYDASPLVPTNVGDATASPTSYPYGLPPSNNSSDEVVEIVPDWNWFDCGWRNASTSIHNVYEKG